MKLVEGSGSRRTFVCPFHGWCWGLDGKNTFVLRSEAFDDANLDADDLALAPVRCELWGGCAWINLDDDAPPLRSTASSRSPPGTTNGRSRRFAPNGGSRACFR